MLTTTRYCERCDLYFKKIDTYTKNGINGQKHSFHQTQETDDHELIVKRSKESEPVALEVQPKIKKQLAQTGWIPGDPLPPYKKGQPVYNFYCLACEVPVVQKKHADCREKNHLVFIFKLPHSYRYLQYILPGLKDRGAKK